MRRNKERPSNAYVEHETLTQEVNRAPPELMALYGVAYLLGIRQTDLRLVEKSAITPDGLKITGGGIAIGLAGAALLTRSLNSLLYGVKPADPITFIAAPALLALAV